MVYQIKSRVEISSMLEEVLSYLRDYESVIGDPMSPHFDDVKSEFVGMCRYKLMLFVDSLKKYDYFLLKLGVVYV